MTTAQDYEIRYQLSETVTQSATASVDPALGIIRGATVAKSGVQATGKFLMMDANGKMTRDPALMRREIPIFTDDKTLETLMQSAGAGGGVFKARSDHDDSLGARAGYANNFKREGDRVTCDLYLNESYADRAIVLEVAQDTPQLIGLSIDFQPYFDIEKDRALMRISELNAVDLVDSGAITHQGLFLKAGVDNHNTGNASSATKFKNLSIMANDNDPSAMSVAMAALLTAVTGLSVDVKGCMAKMSEKPAADDKKSDADDKMAAALKPFQDQLSALSADLLTMKQERAALGLKADPGKVAAGAGSADTDPASRATEKKKNYLELVAEKKSVAKLSGGAAHRAVMSEHPEAYQAHMASKGISIKL